MDANQNGRSDKKTYHKKATGTALETVEKHSQGNDLKLFGSCFWYVRWLIYFLDLIPRGGWGQEGRNFHDKRE